jgi:hypothetical protein
VTGVGDSLGTGVGASEAGVVAGGVVGELAPGDPAGRVSASATAATITRAVEAPARMRFRRDVAAGGRGGSEVMSLLAGVRVRSHYSGTAPHRTRRRRECSVKKLLDARGARQ